MSGPTPPQANALRGITVGHGNGRTKRPGGEGAGGAEEEEADEDDLGWKQKGRQGAKANQQSSGANAQCRHAHQKCPGTESTGRATGSCSAAMAAAPHSSCCLCCRWCCSCCCCGCSCIVDAAAAAAAAAGSSSGCCRCCCCCRPCCCMLLMVPSRLGWWSCGCGDDADPVAVHPRQLQPQCCSGTAVPAEVLLAAPAPSLCMMCVLGCLQVPLPAVFQAKVAQHRVTRSSSRRGLDTARTGTAASRYGRRHPCTLGRGGLWTGKYEDGTP